VIHVKMLPTQQAPLVAGGSRVQTLSVKDYMDYLDGTPCPAAGPLLYWTSQLLDEPPFDSLLGEFSPPAPFLRSEDFLSRWRVLWPMAPPLLRFLFSFRWLFVGPKGSYSRLHLDPAGSAAWNACLQGRKRFVFFRPEHMNDLHIDLSKPQQRAHEFPEYIHDTSTLPHCAQELIVEAGDVIYAPPRWPHFVENLSNTVSLTENFVRCNSDQFHHFEEALASVSCLTDMTYLDRCRMHCFQTLVLAAAAWDGKALHRRI